MVVVDLDNAQEGTEKYDATVVICEILSEAGALGTYKVTATVTQETNG